MDRCLISEIKALVRSYCNVKSEMSVEGNDEKDMKGRAEKNTNKLSMYVIKRCRSEEKECKD